MSQIPTTAPPEIIRFNQDLADLYAEAPPLWEVGPIAARTNRAEGRNPLGPIVRSERAKQHHISTPSGTLRFQEVSPAGPSRGVFLHLHGGGWVLGGSDQQDLLLEKLADNTGLTVVSFEYRLAPEHPYPSAPNECQEAAHWLYGHSREHFGADLVAIGGESAGAHLSAVTCVRLRDRLGLRPFKAALLIYGVYDLRGTPSLHQFGDRPTVLNTPSTFWFFDQFVSPDLRGNPDVSPLLADLTGMPPAIFTVGTQDPLLDDTLFMAARWEQAANPTQLDIWPQAVHGFDLFDNQYAPVARQRMYDFLNSTLDR